MGRVFQTEGTVRAQAFWQEGACACVVVRKASAVGWRDGIRLGTLPSCVHLSLVLLLRALGDRREITAVMLVVVEEMCILK